jgi:hypothetical protein
VVRIFEDLHAKPSYLVGLIAENWSWRWLSISNHLFKLSEITGTNNQQQRNTAIETMETMEISFPIDRAMGPWAGSLDLGTHRNYPRPH